MKPANASIDPEAEPTVAVVPAPVWPFVLLGLLAYWSIGYLDDRGGGFHSKVYGPYESLAYVESLQPKSAGDVMFASGQRIFTTYCSVCHQPTGQGLPGQFPPLAESEWAVAPSPNRIIRLVLDGGQPPMTVKGQVYHGAMPPWRELLKDEEIAAVLTFVRQNGNWGNSATAVTPEQVNAIREKTANRGIAWSADELLQVPEAE